MIELAKHIEYLLLENDCVIIPDFGGFIAHYQPSYYDEVEHVFMPPIRTIGFNPQLSMNDGLLVQSYMQAYHTDYSDAIRIISGKVKELKEILYTEGFFELTGIGTLNYNIYRTYEFNPKENGVLSPALYGLDSFLMTPLSVETIEDPVQIDEYRGGDADSSSEKVIRMFPDWLGNAAAVAIAVVMFFILSVPVENTHVDEGNYASLGSLSLFEEIRSHSFATTVMNAVQEETEVSKEAAEVFASSEILLFGNESQTVGPEDAPMAVHLILLGADVILLEGIRLAEVSEGVYFLNAAPLNLSGADGSPCRALLIDIK